MNLEELNKTENPALHCVSMHSYAQLLTPLMAQLPAVGADQFRDWLVSGVAVLAAGALLRQFVRKPPLEAEFLSKKEFAEAQRKLERDLDAVWGKLDRSFDGLNQRLDDMNEAAEERSAGLHARINEVRSLVDRVDERTKKRA